MGDIGNVKTTTTTTEGDASFNNVVVAKGSGASLTTEHFMSAGDDSKPLPDDYAVIVPIENTSNAAVVGFVDPRNTPVTEPGEKRIYSRDTEGNVVAAVHLKNDGAVEVTNAEGGSLVLQPSGDIVLNGVTIDTNGNITTSGDIGATKVTGSTEVTVGVTALSTHLHAVTTAPGSTGGPVGPP